MRCIGKTGRQLRAIHLEHGDQRTTGATTLMVMGDGLTDGLERALRTAPAGELERLCQAQGVQFWWVRPEDLGVRKPANAAAEDAGEGLSSRLQHLDAVTGSAHAAP